MSSLRVLPIVMLLGAPSLAYRVPTLSPSRMAARTMCQRSGARALRELSHTRLFMTAAGSSSMISEKPDWDQGRGGDATADARDAHLQTAKLALLSAVSGLDRGAAAGSVERKAVLAAAGVLERESTLAYPEDVSKSDGLWRLVYSSALSAGSGSGGGASARNEQGEQQLAIFQTPDTGAFTSFGPGSQVGQVYARISSRKQKLENIVEVFLRAPLPFLPQPGKVVLNLEHKLQLVDNQSRRVKITLVQVTARNQGGPARQLRLPPLKIPVLEALSSQGAGIFETTYCDDMLRITRGDRGEIRIFTKA